MAEPVKLEVTGFKSLNEQLGEAEDKVRNLVNQFGVGSKEVQQAAMEAGKLKQQMMEADKAIESFTASGKFDAVAGGIQGIVGGFAAVQGAMAVVGAESEALQQTLVKVQGALALVEGAKGVMEFAKSFSTLKTMAVSAFNGIKAAIGSTGIGLLIVGLGIAIGFLIDKFNEASKAEVKAQNTSKGLAKEVDALRKAYEQQSQVLKNNTDITLARADLEGKSIKEVHKIKMDALNEQYIANHRTFLAEKELHDERIASAKREGLNKEDLTKKLEEIENDYQSFLKSNFDEERNLRKEKTLEEINYQKQIKDANKKAADEADRIRKEKKKNELDAAKDLREAQRKLAEEKENDDLKNAELRYKNDLERLKEANAEEVKQEYLTDDAKKAIDEKYKVLEKTRTQQHTEEVEKIIKDAADKAIENEEKYQAKIKEIRDKEFADTNKNLDDYFTKREKTLIESNLTERQMKEEQDKIDLERLEAQLVAAKDYKEETIKIEKEIALKKKQIADDTAAYKKSQEQTVTDFVLAQATVAIQQLNQLNQQRFDNDRAALEQYYSDEIVKNKDNAQKVVDLEYEKAIKLQDLERESFETQKILNITQATISGTQAVMNAYAAGAIFTPAVAQAFAITAGVFAATQIALIAAQQFNPSPIVKGTVSGGGSSGAGSQYEQGGLLMGPSHNMGGIRTSLGELEGGEFIMNRRSTANFLPLLEQINAMGNEGGPEMSRTSAPPVIKTYVVASDMTSQQEADARISRLARF